MQTKDFKQVKMMRAKQVAQYLGIGLSTVWLWTKQGKLTSIKLTDRVTVFDIDEVNSFINKVSK